MTKEQFLEIITAVKTDSQLREKLGDRVMSSEVLTEMICAKAKEGGYHLTEEEFDSYMKEVEQERQKKTEKISEEISMLSDEEIDQATGGSECTEGWVKCNYTYKDFENCWSTDGCDANNIIYDGYHCVHNNENIHCGTLSSLNCIDLLL